MGLLLVLDVVSPSEFHVVNLRMSLLHRSEIELVEGTCLVCLCRRACVFYLVGQRVNSKYVEDTQ